MGVRKSPCLLASASSGPASGIQAGREAGTGSTVSQGYGAVLRDPRFVRLWVGQSISNFGDALTRMALLILVAEKTGSAASISAIAAVQLVPMIAFGPFIGVLVDRWNRKVVMIAADVVRGLLTLGIVFAPDLATVYGLAFLSATASLFFMPARTAVVPEIVGKANYISATALGQVTYQIITLIGPAAGGAITGLFGVRSAFLVDAGTFFVSALLTLSVRCPPILVVGQRLTTAEFLRSFRQGIGFLACNRVLRYLVVVFAISVSALGFVTVLGPDYYLNFLGMNAEMFGLLRSVEGAGMLAGAALLGQWATRLGRGRVILGGLALTGVWSAAFIARPPCAFVVPWALLSGLGTSAINVPLSAVFVERTDVEMRGRVFSVTNSLLNVSSLAGLGFGGAVARSFGTANCMGVCGGFVLIVAAIATRYAEFRELNTGSAQSGSTDGEAERECPA
ncbi:MAG: MFS transporter [Betaproteobacteria bacterium]